MPTPASPLVVRVRDHHRGRDAGLDVQRRRRLQNPVQEDQHLPLLLEHEQPAGIPRRTDPVKGSRQTAGDRVQVHRDGPPLDAREHVRLSEHFDGRCGEECGGGENQFRGIHVEPPSPVGRRGMMRRVRGGPIGPAETAR